MKILVADDDPIMTRLVEYKLRRLRHEPVVVADGAAALEQLMAADGPRLAILDWMMPKLDGPAVCRALRASAGAEYVYTILLTARDDRADMVAGLDAGADDFLTKPFDTDELASRLRSGIRVLELQECLLTTQAELREQATRDSLTGCWNRRVILERCDEELARARRDGRSVAVLIADIDHFKQVNDTFGHAAGDSVLRQLTAVMREDTREFDAVGRYGGEEFLLVLPGADAQAGAQAAERLRARLAGTPPQWEGHALPVTISVGVAATAGGATDADALIRAADSALYRAKNAGRNGVNVAAGADR